MRYFIEIDPRSLLVEVKQYDSHGEVIAISNIIPPDQKIDVFVAIEEDGSQWVRLEDFQAFQHSVQRIGLLARLKKWFGAIANR